MDRAAIAVMSDRLREVFLRAGADVQERKTVTGLAFLVNGRAIGQFEERAGGLRARLWLTDKDRATFEKRPTFDHESGWLHVVSDGDVTFIAGLVASAYKGAASGKAAPPSARVAELPTTEDTVMAEEEKKKGASRRPSARTTRTRI